ncbi:hypothetical protein BD309DRAFT_367152 [Dichomitus squalens]|uniref:Uncharacterized protein n=1 Tax=Dichomitus squalens TaxID=114155 RepID=A0A4Q9NG49_9APHY|nr:hypothetical protein BD309DRAFT_367152 [Dichomitus squalens]TBU58484.1 hypothetical protein BD310DRAFT_478919 [Dichomitus squalens]
MDKARNFELKWSHIACPPKYRIGLWGAHSAGLGSSTPTLCCSEGFPHRPFSPVALKFAKYTPSFFSALYKNRKTAYPARARFAVDRTRCLARESFKLKGFVRRRLTMLVKQRIERAVVRVYARK